jgi:isochorismate synthase
MTDLFTKVKIHYEQQLPFVLFCKPNSDKIVGLFQNNDHLYFLENFKELGFVFASFNGETIPFIPQKYSDVIIEKVNLPDFYFEAITTIAANENDKSQFEKLVVKGLEAIQKNKFQKVVLSRKEKVELIDFRVETIFKKLIANYSSAFNYCFFHPKVGMWFGATPEQFLKINHNSLQTVALAGTQVACNLDNVIWGKKEIEEQQLVTDFISSSLSGKVDQIVISSPYSSKAGNLWHIKTDITATLKSEKDIEEIISILHPTSAVCGLPQQNAKAFILENEKYEREYYSGFLGELNIDLVTFRTDQSDLFVNLRCMKIEDKSAELFVGCGITKDSIAEDEYKETVNKSMTMKKVL